MNEEVLIEDKSIPAETKVETKAEMSPVEITARDQGWVSEDEWVESGRSKDDWRPAKEFVDRGELYKSIHSTKRELKQTQAALEAQRGALTALQQHHKYVFETAYNKALSDLKVQKRQAIRAEDMDKLETIDEQIDQLKEDHQKESQKIAQVAQVAAPASTPPEFTEFLDKNPWYSTDGALKDEADAIGFIYLNKGGSKEGLLSHVEKEMKRKFPEKLAVKRAAPNAVAATNRAKAAPADTTELEEGEREIMKTFVKQGIMTEAEYRAELKKVRSR